MNLFNSRRTRLVLRNLRNWIHGRIRQLVHCQLFAPVIRDEDRVWSNCPHHQHRKNSITTTRDHSYTFAIIYLQLHRRFGMNFDIGFRALLDQESYATCLVAGEILIDNASARENQWKLFVGYFIGWVVFNRVKLRFAVGMVEAIFKQSRRAWMIFSRARPKDAVVLLNLFPCYSVVIRIASTRRYAQLVKHLAR